MKKLIYCLLVLSYTVLSRGRDTDAWPSGKVFLDSFQLTWAKFEKACLAGDSKCIESFCDQRILELLLNDSLKSRLGDGWKADKVSLKRKVVMVPYGKYKAATLVIFELTEGGKLELQTMWWV